jgi:uncharacterized protein YjbJ (UPF0337 family)
MINQQVLEGSWNELRGKIREKWGQLTNDDVQQFDGNIDQLVGKIQRKTGEAREKIISFLEGLTEEGGSAISAASEKVRSYARQTSESLGRTYEGVSERVRQGASAAGEMVQQHPARSVGMAFGAGLLVGVVVGLLARSR